MSSPKSNDFLDEIIENKKKHFMMCIHNKSAELLITLETDIKKIITNCTNDQINQKITSEITHQITTQLLPTLISKINSQVETEITSQIDKKINKLNSDIINKIDTQVDNKLKVHLQMFKYEMDNYQFHIYENIKQYVNNYITTIQNIILTQQTQNTTSTVNTTNDCSSDSPNNRSNNSPNNTSNDSSNNSPNNTSNDSSNNSSNNSSNDSSNNSSNNSSNDSSNNNVIKVYDNIIVSKIKNEKETTKHSQTIKEIEDTFQKIKEIKIDTYNNKLRYLSGNVISDARNDIKNNIETTNNNLTKKIKNNITDNIVLAFKFNKYCTILLTAMTTSLLVTQLL